MNRGLIVGVGVLLLGVVIAGFGAYQTYEYQTTVGDTVRTEGTVVSTDVRERTQQRDADNDGIEETVTEYLAVVRYEYSYAGQQYESGTLYPGTQRVFPSRDAAAAVASGYETGQQVSVYVHRDTPSRSFLIGANPPVANYVLLLVGGATVLFGTHAAYEAVTARARPA